MSDWEDKTDVGQRAPPPDNDPVEELKVMLRRIVHETVDKLLRERLDPLTTALTSLLNSTHERFDQIEDRFRRLEDRVFPGG